MYKTCKLTLFLTLFVSTYCCSVAVSKVTKNETPLVAYKILDLWHVLNTDGKEILTSSDFEEIGGFGEGMLRVKYKYEKKWSLIDLKGKIISKTNCDLLMDFKDGLARTINHLDEKKENNKFGFINTKGEQVVPIVWDDATDFTEGKAYIKNDKERGYINTKGEFLFKLDDDIVGYPFSEGKAAISNLSYRVGFIDSTGKQIIDFLYDEPGEFNQGLAFVNLEDKYGYINEKADFVIPPDYTYTRKFVGNRAFVGQLDIFYKPVWGLIDRKGTKIIDFTFERIRDFNENLAPVMKKLRYGFIDTNAKFVIEPKFTNAEVFVNGLAWASNSVEDTYGFINTAGEYLVKIPKPEIVIDLRLNKVVNW